MTILSRVKELRARFNFSQSVLAEKVGVTRQTIAAIEKGDYVPSLLLALTICDVFQLKMEDVFVLNKEGKRMNKLAVSYIVNVMRFVIACWAFIELYYAWIELANIIETEKFPFEVTINMIPLGLLIIVAIITSIFINFKRRNIKLSYWMYPLLFPQEDEREKEITQKACRTTFISFWYGVVIAIGFLTLSPVANLYIPGYPLYILFLCFCSNDSFYVSLYRNKLV